VKHPNWRRVAGLLALVFVYARDLLSSLLLSSPPLALPPRLLAL
jgi:hypothetical protein